MITQHVLHTCPSCRGTLLRSPPKLLHRRLLRNLVCIFASYHHDKALILANGDSIFSLWYHMQYSSFYNNRSYQKFLPFSRYESQWQSFRKVEKTLCWNASPYEKLQLYWIFQLIPELNQTTQEPTLVRCSAHKPNGYSLLRGKDWFFPQVVLRMTREYQSSLDIKRDFTLETEERAMRFLINYNRR